MRLLTGLVIGLMLGALLTIGASWLVGKRTPPTIEPFPSPQPTATRAAGTAANLAGQAPVDQRLKLSVALVDRTRRNDNPLTDLTSLELTLRSATIEPTTITATTIDLPKDHREVLELNRLTIDLFGLKGSGQILELGTTELAVGDYQNLNLEIASLKGQRADGQIVDVEIAETNRQMEFSPLLSWRDPALDHQLIFDLDVFASLAQDGQNYSFTPQVRQIIVDDAAVTIQ